MHKRISALLSEIINVTRVLADNIKCRKFHFISFGMVFAFAMLFIPFGFHPFFYFPCCCSVCGALLFIHFYDYFDDKTKQTVFTFHITLRIRIRIRICRLLYTHFHSRSSLNGSSTAQPKNPQKRKFQGSKPWIFEIKKYYGLNCAKYNHKTH